MRLPKLFDTNVGRERNAPEARSLRVRIREVQAHQIQDSRVGGVGEEDEADRAVDRSGQGRAVVLSHN